LEVSVHNYNVFYPLPQVLNKNVATMLFLLSVMACGFPLGRQVH